MKTRRFDCQTRSIGPKTGLIVPFLGPITAVMKNLKLSDVLFAANQ